MVENLSGRPRKLIWLSVNMIHNRIYQTWSRTAVTVCCMFERQILIHTTLCTNGRSHFFSHDAEIRKRRHISAHLFFDLPEAKIIETQVIVLNELQSDLETVIKIKADTSLFPLFSYISYIFTLGGVYKSISLPSFTLFFHVTQSQAFGIEGPVQLYPIFNPGQWWS